MVRICCCKGFFCWSFSPLSPRDATSCPLHHTTGSCLSHLPFSPLFALASRPEWSIPHSAHNRGLGCISNLNPRVHLGSNHPRDTFIHPRNVSLHRSSFLPHKLLVLSRPRLPSFVRGVGVAGSYGHRPVRCSLLRPRSWLAPRAGEPFRHRQLGNRLGVVT